MLIDNGRNRGSSATLQVPLSDTSTRGQVNRSPGQISQSLTEPLAAGCLCNSSLLPDVMPLGSNSRATSALVTGYHRTHTHSGLIYSDSSSYIIFLPKNLRIPSGTEMGAMTTWVTI